MENKIREYEQKIEKLEKKVSDLENYNASLRECLLKNVQFSTKLSNITYEMDCLLVKKGQEIRDLEKKLAETSLRFSQPATNEMLTDFDIELTDDFLDDSNYNESAKEEVNLNNYVKILKCSKLALKKDSNGHFKCPECDYTTNNSKNCERHFSTHHTDEKPFQCKLCEKVFTNQSACIFHIRGHDDRFKLKCTLCDAKFIYPQGLRKHAKIMHNGDGYTRKRRNFQTGKRKLDK